MGSISQSLWDCMDVRVYALHVGVVSVWQVWVRGYEEHTTGCWWDSCRSFPRQFVGEPLCRKWTGRSKPILYSCLLLSPLVGTSVDTTSGVVCDSLVEVLAYMMDALGFYASCKPSEIRFLSVVMILAGKVFIMPLKEPRAFPCHKDAPDHYLLTFLWHKGR